MKNNSMFGISKVIIKNYRGILDQEFDFGASSVVSIIGDNGSGKSTVLSAINKVLNYEERKKPFLETDSFLSNKEEISITIELEAGEDNELCNESLTEEVDGKNIFWVRLVGAYNDDEQEYESQLFVGKTEEVELPVNRRVSFDEYTNVIYIPPIKLADAEATFFKTSISKMDDEKKKVFNKSVEENLNLFNKTLSNSPELSNVTNEVASKMKQLDMSNKNIGTSIEARSWNIHSHLRFSPISVSNGQSVILHSHGDGFDRMLQIIMKILQNGIENNQNTIILLEEPENNLFYTHQRKLINYLKKNYGMQLVLTTHSPNMIDTSKESQFIRMVDGKSNTFTFNDDVFFFYQQNVSESVFYKNVILVEGHSEYAFFKHITAIQPDSEISKIINDNLVTYVNIACAHFSNFIEFYKKIGLNVYVMTDWDRPGTITRIKNYVPTVGTSWETTTEITDLNKLHEFSDYCSKYNVFFPVISPVLKSEFEDALLKENILENQESVDEIKKNKLIGIYKSMLDSSKNMKFNEYFTQRKYENSSYIFKALLKVKNESSK